MTFAAYVYLQWEEKVVVVVEAAGRSTYIHTYRH